MKTKTFVSFLMVAVMLRIMFVFVTPFGQNVQYHIEGLNDEPAHFNYIKFLGTEKRLPVQTESTQSPNATKNNVFEYYQPPVYYLLCAAVYPILKDKGTLYFGRLLSFVFGILSLVVLFKIVAVFALPTFIRNAIVLFFSLNLTNVYFTSLVSNDSLSWLVALIIIWQMLRIYQKSTDGNYSSGASVVLGGLLGFGMLVKSSTFIFFPVIAVLYCIMLLKTRKVKFAADFLIVMMIAVALAAPWYVRNVKLYNSLFALHVGFGPASKNINSIVDLWYLCTGTIQMFWFPMQHLEKTQYLKMFNYLGGIVVAIHFGIALLYLFRRKNWNVNIFIMLVVLAVSVAAYVKLLMSWNNPEARYLFQGFAAIALLWYFPLKNYPFIKKMIIPVTIFECSIGYAYLFFT